jgi:AGZA family xanthine/uracil permease-like MFS transporter
MQRYSWARRGDVNAFFGLMLDNVAVMIILFTAVASTDAVADQERKGQIRFTQEFVLTRMIPGTALGVLLGDLVYTWLAFRLARKTGKSDVTAMPLGLDTPSTFGIAFLVLLPALKEGFTRHRDVADLGLRHELAMQFAWHVGLATLVMAGVFKLACAPFGNAIRRLVPRAGLLGSLAAIALALIAFLPMLLDGIAGVPVVGMTALVVILITLVAHRELPGRFPGALAAVLIGVVVYQVGRAMEHLTGMPVVPPIERTDATKGWQPFGMLSFYSQPASWWAGVLGEALNRLPVALPFALATIVGGIDCTESAAAAGDEYDTRAILLTEGGASLAAGLLGGVIQTTPYIGHPAYKKMGGAAAYTLATALFIGAVGYSGGFTHLFEWLPRAAMFPILVFVGLEITAQSFQATPTKHYPALALAMLPALAYLITVPLNTALGLQPPEPTHGVPVVQTLRCLANGFLISGMLWAAALAMILDGRMRAAAGYFAAAGLCALVGIIHSPLPSERIDLPWRVLEQVPAAFKEAVKYQTPYHWAAAYGLAAAVLLALGLGEQRNGQAVPGPQEPWGDTVGSALPAGEGITRGEARRQRPDASSPPRRGPIAR